ncbi:MAG: TerB family tellurite resistance protein [Kiloniellaceae bacterium]
MIRRAVINRFKALFVDRGGASAAPGARLGAEEFQVAAAALLVEAAHMDDEFDARERAKILDLVTARFGLSREESESLLEAAEARVAQASHLLGFTRVVKQAFSHEERVELLEMLWEVAYADGELHDFEASLVRRVTGLLHVSDHESGAARKRVLQRLSGSRA